MVQKYTSTCYVLFLDCGSKDLFMERVTIFTVQSTRLIWVSLVE
jgi:hypothetical protein